MDGNGSNLVANCSGNQTNTDQSSRNRKLVILSEYFDLWYLYVDCGCNFDGSLKSDGSACLKSDSCPCESNGICTCQLGYTGVKCNECESGYHDTDGNISDGSATCIGNYNNQPVIWTVESNEFHFRMFM